MKNTETKDNYNKIIWMLKPDTVEGKVVTTLWEQKEANGVGIHLNSLADLES